MKLSPDAITSLLTSLFPSGMIDDLAREREVVVRERKLDVRVLVWTMVVGFAVGGEARSIAAYRRTYNGATGQNLVASSFYDRFTAQLEQLLRDLLDHAVEESLSSHPSLQPSTDFRDVVVADATVVRLIRFLSAFPATHPVSPGSSSTSSTASPPVGDRARDHRRTHTTKAPCSKPARGCEDGFVPAGSRLFSSIVVSR